MNTPHRTRFGNRPLYEVFASPDSVSPPSAQRMLQQFSDQGMLIANPQLSDDVIEQAREFTARQLLPGNGEPTGNRVHNGWRECQAVRDIALNETIIETLTSLYGRRPIPFQTLNFARGSEQRIHSDSIHFNTLPSGFCCGVWIALEDISPDSGPLSYFPGSHHIPDYQMLDCMGDQVQPDRLPDMEDYHRYYEDFIAAVVETRAMTPSELVLPRGQAMIWASGLFHGGSSIRDASKTRFSQVTHYFFEDCLYYTPRRSHPHLGRWWLRRVKNIETAEMVPHTMHNHQFQIDHPGAYYMDARQHMTPVNPPGWRKRLRRWSGFR